MFHDYFYAFIISNIFGININTQPSGAPVLREREVTVCCPCLTDLGQLV